MAELPFLQMSTMPASVSYSFSVAFAMLLFACDLISVKAASFIYGPLTFAVDRHWPDQLLQVETGLWRSHLGNVKMERRWLDLFSFCGKFFLSLNNVGYFWKEEAHHRLVNVAPRSLPSNFQVLVWHIRCLYCHLCWKKEKLSISLFTILLSRIPKLPKYYLFCG